MRLEDLWDDLEARHHLDSFRRVDASHPAKIFAGLDKSGRRGLILISRAALTEVPMLDNIEISVDRDSKDWRTCIWLANPNLKALFSALSSDLVDASRGEDPDAIALFSVARLLRWRRLLAANGSILSSAKLRGLAGELIILKACFQTSPPASTVEAWQGPLGSPQDFVFSDHCLEVKTIQPTSKSVSITSVDQLDTFLSSRRLILKVIALSTAAITVNGAFTLTLLVKDIRETLAMFPITLDEFNSRLLAAGFDDHPDYETQFLFLHGVRSFDVVPAFPKIVRSDLMQGIRDAKYDVLLADIAIFETAK